MMSFPARPTRRRVFTIAVNFTRCTDFTIGWSLTYDMHGGSDECWLRNDELGLHIIN
jgi:hypothetical protein